MSGVRAKSAPLTEVSEFAKSQYGDAYHVSWVQQIAMCARILARLHFRNKQNYVGCVGVGWSPLYRMACVLSSPPHVLQAGYSTSHHQWFDHWVGVLQDGSGGLCWQTCMFLPVGNFCDILQHGSNVCQ